MEIDGEHRSNAPNTRIAGGKNAAIPRAVADSDDPFGRRSRLIGALERFAHIDGDRAGYQEHIRVAG